MGREKAPPVANASRSFKDRHRKAGRHFENGKPSVPLAAKPVLPPIKSKHKTIIEFVDIEKKKKLKFQVTTSKTPPVGYEFVPIGNPELTRLCKDISREQGAMIFAVSPSASTSGNFQLAIHLHRSGHHVRQSIVEQARRIMGDVGYSLPPHDGPEPIPQKQVDIDAQANLAIKDLFPRIPNTDRQMIIDKAFNKHSVIKSGMTVGLAPDIPLSRRVQLAVLAHIRHTHTTYDQLLRQTTRTAARQIIEPLCLDILVKWRGDEENGRDDLDVILKEVVVISDDEDEDEDDDDEDEGQTPDPEGTAQEDHHDQDQRIVQEPERQYAPIIPGLDSLATPRQGPRKDVTKTPRLQGAADKSPNSRAVANGVSKRRQKQPITKTQKGLGRYKAAWEQALDRSRQGDPGALAPRPSLPLAPHPTLPPPPRPTLPLTPTTGYNAAPGHGISAPSPREAAQTFIYELRSGESVSLRDVYGQSVGQYPPGNVPVVHGMQQTSRHCQGHGYGYGYGQGQDPYPHGQGPPHPHGPGHHGQGPHSYSNHDQGPHGHAHHGHVPGPSHVPHSYGPHNLHTPHELGAQHAPSHAPPHGSPSHPHAPHPVAQGGHRYFTSHMPPPPLARDLPIPSIESPSPDIPTKSILPRNSRSRSRLSHGTDSPVSPMFSLPPRPLPAPAPLVPVYPVGEPIVIMDSPRSYLHQEPPPRRNEHHRRVVSAPRPPAPDHWPPTPAGSLGGGHQDWVSRPQNSHPYGAWGNSTAYNGSWPGPGNVPHNAPHNASHNTSHSHAPPPSHPLADTRFDYGPQEPYPRNVVVMEREPNPFLPREVPPGSIPHQQQARAPNFTAEGAMHYGAYTAPNHQWQAPPHHIPAPPAYAANVRAPPMERAPHDVDLERHGVIVLN